MKEHRFYSESQLERAAELAQLWIDQLATTYRREIWDVVRILNFARQALQREERFAGEHAIAQTFIHKDVPRKRRWLNAALHILEFGDAKLRIDFVTGDEATRDRLVRWVIGRNGIYDRSKYKQVWVELPE